MICKCSVIITKPGSAAMTAPNPYSLPTDRAASMAPFTAIFEPFIKFLITFLNANTNTTKIPIIKAASIAQIEDILDMLTSIGALSPAKFIV